MNASARTRRSLQRRAPSPLALEARLMFDGAAVDTAAATAAAAVDHPHPVDSAVDVAIKESAAVAASAPAVPVPEAPSSTPVAATAVLPDAPELRVIAPSAPDAAGGRNEVVFVDPVVTNWPSLVEQMHPGVEVVLLDGHVDGLTQISEYLTGRHDIDAIHILGHGAAGHLDLGSSHLDGTALVSESVASTLRDIGSHLGADGDILLYGCDIGGTAEGAAFVAQLATLTSADLAASSDATGSAALGGNWNLEVLAGSIETRTLDLSSANSPDFLLGQPAVTSVDDRTYTEGSGAVVVDADITVTGGTSYDGKYVRFSLTNGQNTDVLSLTNASNVNASGAISFVGSSVYLGNGTSRDVIGTIDAVENGLAGQALRINFVSTFTNSSFENGLTGWTAINTQIDLGSTSIAGFVTPNDPTNPPNSGNDNDIPLTLGTLQTVVSTTQATDGTKSAQLSSTGMTTRNGFDVVHGPAIYSDIFAAVAGDSIYFDWRALAGGDAYDVFGYLLNTTTGAATTVLNATGTSSSGTTNWATASASIPTTGNYRFVFVSGTYDFSGGQAAGASLYIDNVRVFGSRVTDAVVTSIARQVTFNATSDAPETSPTRIFTVTAVSATNQTASDTGLINITAANDAPTLTGAPQTLAYTENQAPTAIDTQIVVADPDLPTNFNGGNLEVQITVNGAAQDSLSVINQGTAAGQIGVSGSNVTYGGTVIGTIDPTATGANNSILRIALNANATIAATQALARAIGYSNNSDAPSIASRTVAFRLNDGGNRGSGGAATGTRTATVNITAVDDPTVLTLTRSTADYTENDTSFFVDPNLTLADVDSTTLNGAKVIIASNFRGSEDQLIPVSGTNSDGITFSYDSTKGVLSLTGTATIAQYQAALRSVRYNNTSERPDTTPRTITITLGNVVALTINGVNHYYEVVSGPVSWSAAFAGATGRTFQGLTGYLATLTSQVENDFVREKLIADAWIGAADDFARINAAVGSTLYASQAAAEGHWFWVTGPEAGSRISDGNGSPVTATGSFAFWNTGEPNNSGSTEHYGEIYSTGASPGRWNDLPNTSTLAYVVEYSDQGGVSDFNKSLTISPVRVNDAPAIAGSVSMTSINEDALNNTGQLVSGFLSGATDVDGDPVTGIAVTALNSSHGRWDYSLDNGATWNSVGAVSTNSALLLRTTDRVRFVPDGLNADTASITYKAWDRSNENPTTVKAGVKIDATTAGGTTAYSTGTQTAGITVTAINDAPTLSAASPTLTTINEDATGNGGQTVASFLGSTVTDTDSGAQQGIAITSLSSGAGTWQYSTDGGSSWIAVGTVSGNSALLLRDTDLIRMLPNGQNGGSATFAYRAWDRSTGSQGTKVDTSVSGGTTAFSTVSNGASITVTSLNDAPVLSGSALTLAGISEDDINNAGQTVASFLGSTLTDVDSGAVAGIAITAQTSPGTGHWEYNTGSGFTTLGAVTPGSALLLRATDRVRFVPDQQTGGTATLTVRGWDTTTGTAGTTADSTVNGGTTAFSTATATASTSVTEINDAPLFNTAASASSYTEMNAATTVGAGLVLFDDSGNIKGATVRIGSGFTAGDILAVATPGGLTVAYNAATGVLTLSGTATVATYQAALRSVTFSSSSEDPTVISATRTLQWQATDLANATSSISSSTLTIIPTADTPVIANAPASWNYTEDDGTRVLAPSLTLSDADDSFLSGATVTVSGTGYLNAGFEILAATTAGTGITASFDGSTGVLTLSGTDSVANYQRVLRSVTYTNTSDYNNPSAIPSNDFVLAGSTNTRSIAWQVTDANSDGADGSPTFSAQVGNAATTITIYNANEVPQVTDILGGIAHISYVEGGSPATVEGLLTVHDDGLVSSITSAFVRVTAGLEAGDLLGIFSGVSGWVQSGTATSGTLTRGGTTISYNWSLADGDITLATTSGTADQNDYTGVMQQIGYVSNSDDPTAVAATRTLIWRVTDSGGLQSAVTTAQSSIIDITATNDTAAVNSLPANGDIVYTENGPVVVLSPSLTMADPDDTQLASATISISGAGFDNSVEYLSLPGATVAAGSDWTLNNVGGTGINASFDFASGTLTLTGAATLTAYEGVLRQVGYGSAAENPTAVAATRTITWTLTDQFGSRLTDVPAGNDSDPGSAGTPQTSDVTLQPLNDAPALAGLGGTVGYTEGGSAITLANAVTVADTDDTTMSQAEVRISAGFTSGDTLSVATPGSLVVNYDAATGVLTLTGTAASGTYQTALRSIQFSSSSSDPTAIAAARTLSWQITDGNAAGDGALSSAVGTKQVNITATDTPAVIASLPANGAISFAENGSPVLVAPALTLADPDDTQLAGATVTISAGATAGDLLQITNALAGTGISLDVASTATSLVLTGTASLSDYRSILRSIAFSSSSDNPTGTSATRTLSWTTVGAFGSRLTDADGANDGNAGVTSSAVTSQIGLTAFNDAPTLTFDDGTPGDSTDAPVFEQGGAAMFVIRVPTPSAAGGITVTDSDDTQLSGASVVIAAGLSPDDVLSVATPAGWSRVGNVYSLGGNDITVTYNSGTGTLSFSGTAARSAYETLLGNVQYINASPAPTLTGASRQLNWSVQDANSAGDGARTGTGTTYLVIRDRNDSPTILPTSGTASYTEGAATVDLPDIVITDPDPGEIVTATLTLPSTAVGALSLPAGASYNTSTGVWTITGTVANVNAALAAVQFLPATNNDVAAIIAIAVTDGGEDAATAATGSITVSVTAVNDAPVLTAESPVLAAISEDDVNNTGYLVSSFRGAISDVDTGTNTGIVVTGLDPGNGHWEYSINGGTTWITVSNLTDSNALLLRDTDRLRFVPNGSNGTTAGFTYRAWDGTGSSAGALVDASNTGNAAPFSSTFDSAALVVASVNDSPVLADVDGTLPSITENEIATTGTLVSSLLTGLVTDPDTGALQGLAVTGLSSGNGVWQYSLNGGAAWIDVANASPTSALLLRDTDMLRFRPDTLNATAVSFNYRAWDRSTGAAGTFADVASAGANSAFSTGQNTISLAVTAVNDAPVLQPGTTALAPLNEDFVSNTGSTVSAILAGRSSDVDNGAVQGIAVIGTDDGNGRWQYSLDGGTTWVTMAAFAIDTGLLLRDTDRVRFLPNSENATSASFSFRAWDRTSGAPGTTVSTVLTGDDTAFSSNQNTATIAASGLNDSPVLAPASPTLPTLDENSQSNAGLQIATLLGTTVTDVDTGSPQGIAITGLNSGNGSWQYSIDGGTTWVNVGTASTQDALLLRATDFVRFRPDGQNATTANFNYRAWDQSDGAAGGRLDTRVSDVTSSWSQQINTAAVVVTALNDSPVLAPASPTLPTLDEDAQSNAGVTIATLLGNTVTDVDAGALQGVAVTGLNSGNGSWQYSLDGGATWINVGTASTQDALLLRATDFVRFRPDAQNATTASFDYRAWDQSTGTAGGRLDTRVSDVTSSWSQQINTASIGATSLNDPPVLAPAAPTLPTLDENAQNNAGVTIATLLGNTFTDVDAGSPQGIALTGLDPGNGSWQYSLDGGTTWITVATASTQNALLLRATDRVRFRPDAQNATTANFNYRAWDQSTGTAGGRLDTRVSDVTSSWSQQINTAAIVVTAVNDAPINDVLPTVSGARRADGTLRQDGVLTANPQIWHDVDTGDPAVSFRYQWEIADDATGTNLRVITGATASQYTIVAGDIGKYVRVRVHGGDGQVETSATSTFNRISNQVPVASEPLETQQVSESVPLTYTVPASSFTDADGEDTLYYTATLSDGSPLPAWLTFDPVTRTFSGTPGGGDVGVLTVRVTASDHGLQTASGDFTLRVLALPVNLPAEMPPPLPPAAPLSPNVDLSTPVVREGGSAFLQTPVARAVGGDLSADALRNPYQIQESVEPLTNAAGFRIPIDSSPVAQPALALAHPLVDQYNRSTDTWRFSIPADTFTHTQRDAIVVLQATRVDGTPLPAWLTFDASTGQFYGDPPSNFDGVIELRVTAHDNFGNEVSTLFRIHFRKGTQKAFIGRSDVSSQFADQLYQRSVPREMLVRSSPPARARAVS